MSTLGLMACAAVAAVLLLCSTARADSFPWGTNLIQNPGAEAGTCSNASNTNSPSQTVTIPNWTTTGSFVVICYPSGVTLDPSLLPGGGSGFGNAYFMGGVDATTTATQVIDVSGAAAWIDGGGVRADLTGWLGGYDSQDDNMVVTATYLDASSQQLGTAVQIGPVLAADRNDQSTVVFQEATGTVPVGTRTIEVTMIATRVSGNDNDGAADNLGLTLQTPSAPRPGAGTDAATGVTATSAVLNGTVNPFGSPTTYYFEWATDTSYGPPSPTTSVGSDSTNHSVQLPVDGLQPGQTYHFRVVASNANGTGYGNDESFTTAPVSPQRTGTGQCVNVATGNPEYQFQLDPGGAATTVYEAGGRDIGVGSAGDNGFRTVDVPLEPWPGDTTNTFTITASNPAGTISWRDSCFAPDVPRIESPATNNTTQTSLITATIDPRGATTSVHVEYGPTTAYGSATTALPSPGATGTYLFSQVLSNLKAGATYHYRIVAVNAAGTTSSPDATFTTSSVSLVGTALALTGSKAIQPLRCTTSQPCAGTISLISIGAFPSRAGAAKTITIGSAHFRIRAHHSTTIAIRLSRAALRALRRHHRMKVIEVMKTSLGPHGTAVTRRMVVVG